jgi:hypothetical protein
MKRIFILLIILEELIKVKIKELMGFILPVI